MRSAFCAGAVLLAACASGEAPSPSTAAPDVRAAREMEVPSPILGPESAAEPSPVDLPAFPPPPYPEPAALDSLFGAEYDAALAAVVLHRGTARCTQPDLSIVGQGRFRLPLYEALQSDPTLSDRYARTLRDGAFFSAGALETSSMFAAARLGAIVRRGLLGDPLADEVKEAEKEGALKAALEALGAGQVPDTGDAVPPRVQAAAALVLRASARADAWIARAFERCSDPGGIRVRSPAEATLVLAEEGDQDELRRLFEREAGEVDLRYLARAAAEVTLAADRASAWVAEAKGSGPFEYQCGTERGIVQLRGGGDDADGGTAEGPYLLRIDTGGNDRYAGGAASARGCPVSVLIDAGGDDTYESVDDQPAFGAGSFGVGVLVDLEGNDRYTLRGPHSIGLGAGVFGVGALLDRAGDDAFAGDGFCMGAGTVGWGTCADLSGNDRYEAFSFSQGYGGVLGVGILTDTGGDDRYVLNDHDIRRPAAQSKEHNDSLGQGFGLGVRADYIDGHSLAGGVGILADREGDDAYSCGVFGQGGGYWMGVGMLLDGAGNDSYDGVWYVQGACAHFAVGILDDASGDDRYTATLNMAQGAGHDYSLGVLLDHAGNDRHRAPNLSLGGGNSNGVGIFVDGGGDDVYQSAGTTLGLASMEAGPEVPTLRHGSLTFGAFLDLGGTDSYLLPDGSPQPFAGRGRTWTQAERAGKPPFSNLRGVGADR